MRVLNCGGFANPDVLRVENAAGEVAVVKDYARRSALVRGSLARWWVTRELAILRRLADVDGVPRAHGRIDAWAFAMSWIEGAPLRRRDHAGRLPDAFFSALRELLDALADRGLLYLDLSSPSNVLLRPDGRPALVDLASALRAPAPAALRRALEHRALAKLRLRFAVGRPEPLPADPRDLGRGQLKVGATRLGYLDRGPALDPRPVVLLAAPDADARSLAAHVALGAERGHRVLAIDPPEAGRPATAAAAGADRVAVYRAWLDALRLGDCLVAGFGRSEEAARALERARPATAALTCDPDPARFWERVASA